MKKYLSIFLTLLLVLSITSPAFAADQPSAKEEVVYGLLNYDGSVQEVYVVNSFKGGEVSDYGNYTSVTNMTSNEKIDVEGNHISVNTGSRNFYYQGTLADKELPWNIDIKYYLDDKEIPASDLGGRDGALKIAVSVSKNRSVGRLFSENYMLQISLTLNTESCTNIESQNATLANAGKNKVIAHSIMPGMAANFTITADVTDFSMPGFEITGMPMPSFIDIPDTAALTEDLTSLVDAVDALNGGIGKLSDGISQTYTGAQELSGGSAEISAGLTALSKNSSGLTGASAQIKGALNQIISGLGSGGGDIDLSDLSALSAGLKQMSSGLGEISMGMNSLKEGYSAAFSALNTAIVSIPDDEVDPRPLYAAVYGDSSLTAALDTLVEYYAAAKTVKGTYVAVEQGLTAVAGTLTQLADSVSTIAGTLSGIATQIEQTPSGSDISAQMAQLKAGMTDLLSNYTMFHDGLVEYTGGVAQLSNGHNKLNTGVSTLSQGLGQLSTGSKDLYQGSTELNTAVTELPDTMKVEIDRLTDQYVTSDFELVSFTSEKNTEIKAVQFVIKTQPIDPPEGADSPVKVHVKLSFWQKLLKLFGLYRG